MEGSLTREIPSGVNYQYRTEANLRTLTLCYIDQFEHLQGEEMPNLVARLFHLDKEDESIVDKGSIVFDTERRRERCQHRMVIEHVDGAS